MRKIKFLICVMSLSIYSQLLFAASLYFPIKEIDLGRYAEVHVNKSIVQPNEVAELTITGYAYPIDLMSYNEHTKHQHKYNLYKLTIRTNDPYQNYIDLYFLYSIEDKD